MERTLKTLAFAVALALSATLIGAQSLSAGPPGKVDICHKDKVTINVSWSAAFTHIFRHGDSFGECGGGDPL